MESYDEDLNENPFFHMLQTEHTELFQKATVEGWIICVPCEGSVPKYALTVEDFFSHILIPSDELPESHFRTLNDRDVRICNRVVTVEENDISRPVTTHILFEETYYTDDLLKYKVLCLEHPLERHSDFGPVSSNSSVVISIQTLRDCIDLLWTESRGRDVLEKIDQLIRDFLSCNNNLEFEPLQVQKDLVGSLYTVCLQNALRDSRLRERTSTNKHLLENVKLAVETYMLHTVYKKVIKGVTACTAHDDANLNKIIRNLSDIQLRDLGVRQDLYDTVPWAKQELARIDGYSTVLGKVGCLKRMLGAITKQHPSKNSPDLFVGNVIAADDLLPMIVFLVIKTGLPNWIAHLTFMKQFHFSNPSKCQVDEYSFLITSLEAAIEHINSGLFLGSSIPEAQIVYEEKYDKYKKDDEEQQRVSAEPSGIECLFEQIKLGNESEVKDILDRSIGSNCMRERESSTKKNDIILKLCHPLCSCDKCESIISKSLCNTTPTINSCDDRGFTALHVACMFGRPTMVDLLLKYGSNVNACDYSGSTPVHYAAAKGYQNALLLLAHAGAHIDIADNEGNTPLHLACNNGHEGCVKAIIYFAEHVGLKLNINCANSQGNTALHNAARWGYEGIVHLLLENGARPGAENKRHITPLDYAHNIHITRLLMRAIKTMPPSGLMPGSSNGIVTNLTSKSKELHVAASSKKTLDFSDSVKPRKVSGASLQKGSKTKKVFYGVLPETTQGMRNVEKLLKAIAAGDTRLACYYMGLDANDEAASQKAEQPEQQHEKCHPLCTCEKCQPENDVNSDENGTDEEHSHHILDVNVCDGEGFTPLHVAAMHGRLDLTRLLIDAGALVDVRTRTKAATPLHFACQNQRLQVVQLLLRRSADPDIQDWHGNTALHYACYVGNIRLVETLLQLASPRLDLKNASGKSAVQEAEEKMALTIVKLLRGGKQFVGNGDESKDC
ncbi:ankyrin repeat domain-containing protein 27-like [Schistocerca piceifrons]|uniref:ankyrin repeat domain-containing protein 27-like n=1 Tax=Schistocerca piceifrons TaxID=274613 RepID=UPI001F5FA842|nr:ankyrin repeat domain-containing protein 27-like [Schistocerca piceifrons]